MSYDTVKDEAAFDAFKRQLTIIYYAIMGAMAMVYVVFVIVLAPQSPDLITEGRFEFELIVPIVNVVIVAAASFLFRMQVKRAVASDSTATKINFYRTGHLLRGAMLEGLAILNAFAYYAMHDFKFEIMFLLVALLYIVSAYPNAEKMKREMGM